MKKKARKPSRLARELKEMGDALHRLGALSDDEHAKITMRQAALDKIERDTDRDNFMTPDEAKAYGLVDDVVKSRKEIPGLIYKDNEKQLTIS